MKFIDFEYLENLTAGDNDTLIIILEKIIEESRIQKENINKYLAEKNWDELKFHSHKLKSSMLYLNNTHMHGLLKDIEHFSFQKTNLDAIPNLVKEFNENIDPLIDEIELKLKELMA